MFVWFHDYVVVFMLPWEPKQGGGMRNNAGFRNKKVK